VRHLVTGGAGFIGSHLCERLIAAGDDVICLDNLFTGRRRNIERLLDVHRFEFVRGDVCDPFHFEVDRIWHLACPASPVHYQRNPARTIETAVFGTRNALAAGRAANARVLVASTSEVYGDPLEHPQKETYWGNCNPCGPRSNYDEGKRCGEALCRAWSEQYGVDVRIARIFNCYGPRMAPDDGRVVSNLIVQALSGKPMTIYGDGQQTRSFIHVNDLVGGLMRLMDVEAMGYLPVNLGNPCEFTISQLADLIEKKIGPRIRQELPLPEDDPVRRKPDISKAKLWLNWEPVIPIETGLDDTIAYFENA
jgi:UDP-glucuronate decarboxylase